MLEHSDAKEPSWFLVTSIGRTATYWLAWSLNRHPDILCSHGDHFPPNIVTFDENGRTGGDLSEIGKPIRSFYDLSDRQTQGMDQNETRRGQKLFQEKTVSEILDAQCEFGECSVIGNVHGYTMDKFIERHRAGELNRSVKVVNLIRNPVGQILSFYRRHKFDAEQSEAYKTSRIKFVEQNIEIAVAARDMFDIDLENHDTLIFLSTAIDVAHMQKDILIENVAHLPYEELTRSQRAFETLLRLITGDADIAIEQSYLDDVFSQGPMNYSSKQETPVSEAFDALEDWRKFVITELISEDVARRYGACGYDMNFILDRASQSGAESKG